MKIEFDKENTDPDYIDECASILKCCASGTLYREFFLLGYATSSKRPVPATGTEREMRANACRDMAALFEMAANECDGQVQA